MPLELDTATLQAALLGYRQQLDQIQHKMSEIRQRLGKSGRPRTVSLVPAPSPTRRRNAMSEEGRARIAAAQKARWARARKLARKAERTEDAAD